jgi:predicted NAD/FAD-binding protein
MEIGIIGAGAAGLTAAWLLNGNHNVTLFEKQDRLGGHAQTVDIEIDGFEAQRSLSAFQGQNNLWLAGLYTHDIDSHESAIRSAVKVAEGLDPRSAGLKLLIESHSF